MTGHFAPAHAVAHQRHVLQVQRVECGFEVIGQRVVIMAIEGFGGIPEAAAGVSNGTNAVLGQLAKLIAPGIVAKGPAVNKDRRGALALIGAVQFYVLAIGVLAGCDIAHG